MPKRIVLFDMDGTLTEPREEFDPSILDASLYFLTNSRIEVGIVTGSGIDYLKQQMGDWLNKSPSRYRVHLFPCNGTQYLKPPDRSTGRHELIYSVSMEDEVGHRQYRNLIKKIIDLQSKMSDHPIPLSGHFIDYRGSMINWCPIGREASTEKRNEFIKFDEQLDLRSEYLNRLNDLIAGADLENLIKVKLGGDTSFDIYPTGWDKTYALKHLSGYDVWFVGDRCGLTGNDYELYNHCGSQGFVSIGPASTKKIIDEIIKNLEGGSGE